MRPLQIPILNSRARSTTVDELVAPSWVAELMADAATSRAMIDGIDIRVSSQADLSLVTARVHHAADLSADDFEQATVRTYHQIQRALAHLPAAEPVRFWNHLPTIHQAMDIDRDRYMVFNAGRYRAFCDWFGGSDQLASRIVTASGVGHRGRDLVIHCLGAVRRGKAVENPRQIPAFRYSKKYGPLPPCFARATLASDLPTGRTLLVGGTASICGERSVHRNQLTCQFRETAANLAALIRAADASVAPAAALAALTHVRIYHPRPRDARAIDHYARAAFTRAQQIELIGADLCRADLLVEIEGVAQL